MKFNDVGGGYNTNFMSGGVLDFKTKLKNLKSRLKKKTNVSSQEFINYLYSYGRVGSRN